MNIPIPFKIPGKEIHRVGRWITEMNLFGSVSYDWIKKVITFEHEEDAIAFMLTFGIQRHETIVDRMIKNEIA